MLTVPGDAPESQRAAMRRAARMADLKVVRMVTEATVIGAGLTGGFTGTVLVYDLGSGCFVATVLRVTHDRITVLGNAADHQLGGDDLDLAMRRLADAASPRSVRCVMNSTTGRMPCLRTGQPATDPELIASLGAALAGRLTGLTEVDSRHQCRAICCRTAAIPVMRPRLPSRSRHRR